MGEGWQSGKMLYTTFFLCKNCVCVAQTSFSLRILLLIVSAKLQEASFCWRLRKHVLKPPACLLQHLGTDSRLMILHWLSGLVSLPSKHGQGEYFEHWELFWRALGPYLVFLLILGSDTFYRGSCHPHVLFSLSYPVWGEQQEVTRYLGHSGWMYPSQMTVCWRGPSGFLKNSL